MLIKELLFPRRCPVCDRVVALGTYICRSCLHKLKLIEEPRCCKCGKELEDESREYCFDCERKKHFYKQGLALYEYNSVCSSIYRFKYSGRAEYADYFGCEMARTFKNRIDSWQIDGIIPVPLHKSKLKLRGYNQAALLAKSMADYLNIPYYSNYVIRRNKTIALKELAPLERQINLKNAFIIGVDDVKLKRVVIVDDIYTTGSTIDEITKLLLSNGANQVYFITLAIGAGM